MGYLKPIAGAGVLLAAWICTNAQTTPAQDQVSPDSMYYVSTDYGWTMSSRESSGYYMFNTPLRMRMRISFADLGDGRLQMHLHFYEVSYSDQRRNWTITDFSDPEIIRYRLYQHSHQAANLDHLTQLAAFEEEFLAYVMALSHGMTFIIDPSEDTSATFSNLRRQFQIVCTGIQTPGRGRPVKPRPPGFPGHIVSCALGDRARLGMMWTQQLLDLAMFAQRPAYKTLTPCRGSLDFYRSVKTLGTNGSPAESRTRLPEVPAFSLCGLYRWLPVQKNFFAHLDATKKKVRGNLFVTTPHGPVVRAPGAWFVGTDRTYHTVEEALDNTSSGEVKYRRITVVTRMEEVDALGLGILINRGAIRGTITVTGETALEATLVDPTAATDLDRIEDAVKKKDYDQALALCRAHLGAYPDAPQARQMRQQLDELAAMKAEQEEKRIRTWTKLAELGLCNGRPDVARVWLMKIIREYPQTTWAAKAQQRLSDLPPITIPS
ncbi:MAG: tol-pal system YbgF family protein [Planctomycetota bacterium]|jgi:hypothetical protein